VLVTLLDNTRIPIAGWLFMKAYPVKWSVSDLDADANSVVIEHMDLTYQRHASDEDIVSCQWKSENLSSGR